MTAVDVGTAVEGTVTQTFQNLNAPNKWRRFDRGLHVFRPLPDGRWKCVICGGVTADPSYNNLPEKFEALTDEDRRLCPQLERKHY